MVPSCRDVTNPEERTHPPAYLTVREIARDLRVSEATAITLIRAGAFPALRIGPRGLYRIPRAAYEAWKRSVLEAS